MIGIDPVVETLLLPFRDGILNWPIDGTLFLRARASAGLQQANPPLLICDQTFKPNTDELIHAGFKIDNESLNKFSLILILPPRQREESHALMARAWLRLKPGGRIVACAANNEGAKSHEADLEKLCGSVCTLSKNKCRVFWTEPLEDAASSSLQKEWFALDAPRLICNGRFLSRPGIFAWDRIDTGSELLAQHLPPDLSGHVADLGAGFGYISAEIIARCKSVASIDLYEAEKRALDLAEKNMSALEPKVPIRCHWQDVTKGLLDRYDVIVTNPPFHTQRQADRTDIGRRFIQVAAESLQPDGQLWLVANRHLPYEAELTNQFASVRTIAQTTAFKVLLATQPR